MTEQPDRLLSSVVSAMADCVAEVERLRAEVQGAVDLLESDFADQKTARRVAQRLRAALAPKEPME